MKYDEVKPYARVYAAQDRFVSVQKEFLGQLMKVNADVELLTTRPPPPTEDLRQLQRELRLSAMSLLVLRQFADGLGADYERISKTH